jgi:hypothetical protein
MPLFGMVLGALMIISRRPDAVAHAQFWAEDGSMFYADVYQHGMLATLLVPQSGYFQEFPVLVAGLETLVPLHLAPLVGNLVAIIVRTLPVGLLLSDRARTITPSLRTRAFLAALYICLPGVADTNANVDNALWYLAVSAIVVIVSAPPRNRRERTSDGAILCLCAATGVFAIAIAPLLWLFRSWRGREAVATWVLALFAVAATIQLFAIGYLQHHLPLGYSATSRVTVQLHASVPLFFEIVGRRVVMEPLGLETASIVPLAVGLVGLLGMLAAADAIRHGTPELRLFLLFAAALVVMALADPSGADWSQMTLPPDDGRYFLVPEYAFAVVVIWQAGRRNVLARRGAIVVLAAVCVVAIPAHWSYKSLADRGFAAQALVFEKAPSGTRMDFPLNPVLPRGVWHMTLVRG